MTSRVEAFGMTGVEAMSQGCISIVADNPCLPEIFNNAATFYKPYSGEDLANKILTLLSWDSGKLLRASETARQRALEFSWDNTVEQTINEFILASQIRNN
jgi:glycosyltransferase involved in cell wall biosynthesis